MQSFLLKANAHKLGAGCRSFHTSRLQSLYFDKILIANRGEIACRVMKTCKKLGIKTVAVHSDADVFAKHVAMADEAVNIGLPPSSQSYLCMDKIVEAAKKTGAQAIHPGYGFLSENAKFVAELQKNNIVFIGPGVHAMEMMGDKIESKKIAKEAGVHIIPGKLSQVQDAEEAVKIANEIGYPVMIKASGGGGGKGMRIAWNDKDTRSSFTLCKQEAMASFGRDDILIERFIDNPRHIEIQVMCDKHGNRVYLNERECSIQRRNQKVIEEAPSSFLTPEVRKAMGEQAISLCKRVGYESAGTVEFLVDPQRNFYFLEMNTRLQVEHPVTEYITGFDLVEMMIKVAAGKELGITQADVGIKGWAMESRVYAEDPYRGFLPSIGRLVKYKEPLKVGDENVRCDSGITEGSDISIYYDPLICKLVTHGDTRQSAIDRHIEALDAYVIHGVNHNVAFLRDVFVHPRFTKGDISTKFIPQEYPQGYKGHQLTPTEQNQLLSLTASLQHASHARECSISDKKPDVTAEYVVKLLDKQYKATVTTIQEKVFDVTLEGQNKPHRVDLSTYKLDTPIIWATVDGVKVVPQLIKVKDLGYDIQFIGTIYNMDVLTVREAAVNVHMLPPKKLDTFNFVRSPMAGALISVEVKEGQTVVEGQEIAVVEAMKMRNVLRSERSGKIKRVAATPGKSVALEEIIVEFDQ
eukprot:TRINITY_DN10347_c0_g1_i1.p1 TRINITY_DN10347_c0_g1~~TRINITY_DN10347_c0_g1_i1.p1  ORF type:complete len:694 (+),score=171.07 TRINITY_DN10347_c0_g1_i1:75-2156(+)